VGILLTHELHKLFGYVPSSRLRILLATREVPLREGSLREVRGRVTAVGWMGSCTRAHGVRYWNVQLLTTIHGLYADAISNPFCDADGPLTSARFVRRLDSVLDCAVQRLEFAPNAAPRKP
jgi:hypothetical protein